MYQGQQPSESYLTRIRGVALLPGERVTSMFSPSEGTIDEPTGQGRLLVATNQRLLSFSQGQQNNETVLVPVEEMKGMVVKGSAGAGASLVQVLLMIAGGLIIYLFAAYTFTGKFDGPQVPILNIDLGALLILLAVGAAGWFIAQHYFAREPGLITFQGSNWVFTFPYASEQAEDQVYGLVNAIFAIRQSRNGYHDAPPPALEQPPVQRTWRD